MYNTCESTLYKYCTSTVSDETTLSLMGESLLLLLVATVLVVQYKYSYCTGICIIVRTVVRRTALSTEYVIPVSGTVLVYWQYKYYVVYTVYRCTVSLTVDYLATVQVVYSYYEY